MSEYWISQPNFGTTTMKSTVVHTPRNVDLPVHVVLKEAENKNNNRKRKCLCLSVWLIGLLLLTAGAVVVAHFLMPETFVGGSNNDSFRQVSTCSDILPLEDKVRNAEIILVGAILPNMSVEVVKMIKGQPFVNWPKLHKSECFEQSATRQIFFLAPERQGRSVVAENEDFFMPKYQALIATPKVVEIVEKLAAEFGEKVLLVTPQPVMTFETSTEGKLFLLCVITFEIGAKLKNSMK